MTVVLVDTSSVFLRAFHALPPMNTSTGEPTSAVYGTAVLLLKVLREERPSGLAFARDLPKPTFRHRAFDAYKAGRPALPDSLRPQWKRLDQLVAATGAPSHSAEGFEADDVLATSTRRLVARGEQVIVVTGDRDLYQVVGPSARVLFLGARGKKPEMVDEAVVRARYGVAPAAMPTWAALVGEAADNLPGVPAVGAKTASRLVSTYGDAKGILANLDSVTPARTREAIALARDALLRDEDLATLRTEVDLGDRPLVAPFEGEAVSAVRGLFEELEFKSLVTRLDALVAGRPG